MSTSRDLPLPESVPSPREREWPAQAADTIVDVVGKARQKTTGPALTGVRGVVYGLLVVVVATMAVIVLIVGLVRLLNNWLDVWLTYLVLGALFVIAGGIMWRQRAPAVDEIDGNGDIAPRR